jgi:hypothetical protein
MGDEALRGGHGLRGIRRRGHSLSASEIIGDGLEFVGLREEAPQERIDARIVLDQPKKFRLDAVMRLRRLSGALENVSLRDIKLAR